MLATIRTITLMSAAAEKAALRKSMRTTLRELDADAVRAASRAACERALALDVVSQCTCASVYLAMPTGECQTDTILRSLFDAGKSVYIPRVTGKAREEMQMLQVRSMDEVTSLPRNAWGIPEPPQSAAADGASAPSSIDLVVVPGVSFDRSCGRLGHGKGYYDSFLERLQAARHEQGLPPARTVGLGLQEQLVERVPLGPHDVRLDYVCLPESLSVKPQHDTP
uniref:5-formyltetrahydrofolate cyclo-ligase n=1 Tax=Calcidiscus leptoporus TaxID=127549 RepID=A0A7S0P191_9EUKA|mmetsp:Transcript_43783/g.102373  ORF Transcript_43783/g.102373 Transcript_43783/m.102373 type:complete len:224 (+) Transcript_43783:16-687(+)